jgi:hypothetical protein
VEERNLRYRINKKIKIFMQTELPLLKDRGFAAAVSSDAAAISGGSSSTGERSLVGRGAANPEEEIHEISKKIQENSAGSGNSVPHSSRMGEEKGSSNPRVLSDMGLAIPRPTRLGDPRSFSSLVSASRISVPMSFGISKLLGPLQHGCNAAAALRLCSSNKRSFLRSLHLMYRCCAFVNCLVPLMKACSVGLRRFKLVEVKDMSPTDNWTELFL